MIPSFIHQTHTHDPVYFRRQLAYTIRTKSPKSDTQIASTQEKRNALLRRIKKWREHQFVYMPGVAVAPSNTPEGDAEDNAEAAKDIPLLFPSSLDTERRERICLGQVAEHEQLLRMAQLQDSLAELRRTRKIRRKLLMNHYVQIAGQGQRANTRSRAVLNSVESRVTRFVESYRSAYQALLQLDPTGDWKDTYLELRDGDNRGPGKERDEEGVGDGTYRRSWIWLPNPRAPDNADGIAGEEGASEEDVNETLRVEWTTSFARLERWKEEVELLQEEMRRVVVFLEWKSRDWLTKVEAPRGNTGPDIESGLNAYARKQAAILHNLALSFTKLWRPTLVSYNLKHSWATEFLAKNGVPLTGTDTLAVSTRGIFKFRLAGKSRSTTSDITPSPSTTTLPFETTSSFATTPSFATASPIATTPAAAPQFTTAATPDKPLTLEEYDDDDDDDDDEDTDDSYTESGDSDSEEDWVDDLEF